MGKRQPAFAGLRQHDPALKPLAHHQTVSAPAKARTQRRVSLRDVIGRVSKPILLTMLGLAYLGPGTLPALAQTAAAPRLSQLDAQTVQLSTGKQLITVSLAAANVLQVQRVLAGVRSTPTLVLGPYAKHTVVKQAHVSIDSDTASLWSSQLNASIDARAAILTVKDAQGVVLLRSHLQPLERARIDLSHAPHDALYGIRGFNATESARAGLLRQGTVIATAGEQGHAGAPFVWSTAGYGVLVDSMGARFQLRRDAIGVDHLSRADVTYDIIVGPPREIFAALQRLSGSAPMFPKWAMGFTNSQWGMDQHELLAIVDGYRSRHIPIDNITLDFDWKAWGEDNFGEFRWNANTFPDGPTGQLKSTLDRRGIHLTGIMKPRIHVQTSEGRFADAHDFWFANQPATKDYFSHKPVRELDFDKAEVRAWFFNDALKHAFDTGIVGWWNDEADDTGNDTQFTNMQRALYQGQRARTDQRVWSINRNFYLGAQRYAYGMWSGDIDTGFASMAGQRQRMLSAIDVGEMKWGMDGGGFKGHPSDENYARWVEFGAFTPIFRVHGDFGEKRQPWRYGADAERAATAAIRLRYRFIPYIYASEHAAMSGGVGIVHPLTWDYPDDSRARNDVEAWMFGDSLLVAPVVAKGQTQKRIYLPQGHWIDYFTGATYQGGKTITYAVDSKHWSDVPLFIRDGAIIPTQPVMDYVGQQPVTELDVDVFPAAHASQFDYYDDDGDTYAYERGVYFSQTLTTQRDHGGADVTFGAVQGSFKPALKDYLLLVHGIGSAQVTRDGQRVPLFDSLAALQAAPGDGCARGHDHYGDVTYVKVHAGTAQAIHLVAAP